MSETTPDISTMTPAEAGAFLERKSVEYQRSTAPPEKPSNSAEAQARLDHLVGDREWGKKLEAGDAEVNKEFHALTALAAEAQPGDRLEAVLAGQRHNSAMIEVVRDGELSTSKLASAVDGLREAGISDPAVIKQAIAGTPVTRAEVDATRQLKAQ